jgi:hypothetical protein
VEATDELNGRTSERWERRGTLHIAVSTTQRAQIAEEIQASDASRKAGARVLRLRASQRNDANVQREQRRDEFRLSPPAPRPEANAAATATLPEGLLSKVLGEHPACAALRPSLDEVRQALRRLMPREQERWLGLRNGQPRKLKPPGTFDAAAAEEAARTGADAEADGNVRRALIHIADLLASAPREAWNLVASALAPRLVEESGAHARALARSLPSSSGLEIPLPLELTIPLVPRTATWRLGRILDGQETADDYHAPIHRKAAADALTPELRTAIHALATHLEHAAPEPDDDEAWAEIALHLLRRLLESEAEQYALVAARPAEPATYAALGHKLLDAGHPWLAERTFSAALLTAGDHLRSMRGQTAARQATGAVAEVVIAAEGPKGKGVVERAAGDVERWEVHFDEDERWAERRPLAELNLSEALRSALQEAGYSTIGDLRAADPRALFDLPHVGRTGVRAIRMALESGGSNAPS